MGEKKTMHKLTMAHLYNTKWGHYLIQNRYIRATVTTIPTKLFECRRDGLLIATKKLYSLHYSARRRTSKSKAAHSVNPVKDSVLKPLLGQAAHLLNRWSIKYFAEEKLIPPPKYQAYVLKNMSSAARLIY